MTDPEFAAVLWPIVEEYSGRAVPADQDLDVGFGDIDLDSLTQAEIFGVLEETLGLQFRNDDLFSLRTPRQLLELINRMSVSS